MKLNNKGTHASSTEEFALTDTELETVLGGYGGGCTPPYGGSPDYGSPYYGGGSPYYGGGSPYDNGGSPCGGTSPSYYAPNYGSYGPNTSTSPYDSGSVGYSVTTSTTTYYTGAPTPSGSSCGGSY